MKATEIARMNPKEAQDLLDSTAWWYPTRNVMENYSHRIVEVSKGPFDKSKALCGRMVRAQMPVGEGRELSDHCPKCQAFVKELERIAKLPACSCSKCGWFGLERDLRVEVADDFRIAHCPKCDSDDVYEEFINCTHEVTHMGKCAVCGEVVEPEMVTLVTK